MFKNKEKQNIKKNVGSGLILGSVGLRQYNNYFFFWPNSHNNRICFVNMQLLIIHTRKQHTTP